MRIIALIYFCFIIIIKGYTQDSESRFYIDAGLTGRVTIFYLKGVRGQTHGKLINATAPYSYLKGVNGTGVNIAFGYTIFPKYGINLQTSTSVRYDFYRIISDNNFDNTFYIDQSFFITKSIRKYYAGIGFTAFSIGKELHFIEVGKEKVLELHFNSIDLIVGAPIWKINFEPKFSIVQSNFPGSIKRNATLLGARVYYRFKFKNKR